MKHSITVRYECDTCHKRTKTIKYNGERHAKYSGELRIEIDGWYVYGDGIGGNKHECPDCHTKRLDKLPAHLR